MSIYSAVSSRLLTAAVGVALACGPALAADSQASITKSAGLAPQTVAFVCKYGSVKSLVAAERFNRLAEQRGLNIRAIGRAANPGPEHTHVHELVVRQLALEGLDVADYKPQALTPSEAASAIRIVHISLQGEDDPDSSPAAAATHVKVERWNDVPSMLRSSDSSGNPTGDLDLTGGVYQKARTPLVTRVDALFNELANAPAAVAGQ